MEQTLERKKFDKTLLVVDDEPVVLSLLSKILKREYNILVANNGTEALQLSKDFNDEIHLLLTDFQMAGMNGIELATQITVQRPEIKVLLMSGFSGGMLVLNEGWHFLPKPFIASQLRRLIDGLIYPAPNSRFLVDLNVAEVR
jgi:two-component system cell cycle sensor histidine kinase/response regulator CckA